MAALQICLFSIGAFLMLQTQLAAQSEIEFATNGYFTFGDPDGRTAAVALADFDGDGDLDVFAANGRHWAQQDYVYLNNGAGRLLTAVRVGELLSTAYKPAIADLDKDGDLDIVSLRDRVEGRIMINDEGLNFIDAGAFGVSGPARSASVADIDNNGRLDAVIAQRSGSNYVVYNLGRRNNRLVYIDQETQSVRGDVADFNGDGFIDAAFANIDEQGSYIVLNDGKGALNRVIWLGADTAGSIDIAAADMDKDGDVDLVLGSWDRENKVLINDGHGDFSPAISFGLPDERTFGIAVADLNNDGRNDIIAANNGQPNAVYLAMEALTFERVVLPADETASSYGVVAGDLNGDGRPDLVFANSDARNRIHINVAPEDAASVLRR